MGNKATILAVDDDRIVLNAVERDLRQKYGRDYRVLKAESGAQALAAVYELKKRGESVAVFVADQRMPEMSGVQFLEQAITIFPKARKVLLTAYSDTEAAIQSINKIGLDYYLMKPWDPPEEHFYPVLDSLLEEWRSDERPVFEGIRVVGTLWSAASHDAKDLLARNSIPYQWYDLEANPEARRLLQAAGQNGLQLPVIFFPDGSLLVEPGQQQIAEKVGLSIKAQNPFYDVIIIGAGPAGLSAAVYASSDGLKVLIIERQAPGGQAGNSPRIENFLGFPNGISGNELTRRAVAQARRFGAEILTTQAVSGIKVEGHTKTVVLADGSEINCKIILIATGAWFRMLDLPGIEHRNGRGVFYGAAHTEAAYFRDQPVIVIGGANSAAQGMLFLSRYASKVTVCIRGAKPDWSQYLDSSIRTNEKIEILTHTEVSEILGEQSIEAVVLRNNQTGALQTHPARGIFVFIGQKPQSDFVSDLVMRTDRGHILTGLDLVKEGKRPPGWTLDRDPLILETNIPGVFAAGDVRNGTKHGVAAATGDGDAAVSLFWEYLATI